jgi:hypothetical protein
LDDGKIVCGVYLDLQKAFDTVNHDILLVKLSGYSVRGIVHNWFRSYHHHRQQFINLSSVSSEMRSVSFGGSVLGPLLFLSYINDIGNAVPSEKQTICG